MTSLLHRPGCTHAEVFWLKIAGLQTCLGLCERRGVMTVVVDLLKSFSFVLVSPFIFVFSVLLLAIRAPIVSLPIILVLIVTFL